MKTFFYILTIPIRLAMLVIGYLIGSIWDSLKAGWNHALDTFEG